MSRWRKRRVLAVVAMGLGLTAAALSTSTYLGRWVWWNRSDIGDIHRFPSRPIPDGPSTFSFAVAPRTLDPELAVERDGEPERVRLSELARSTGTTALLVVRRDTLLFEGCYGGHGRDSLATSFSVAKSVVGLLAGIAFRDHDLPWGDRARAYYDAHLRQRVLEEIEIERPPAREWTCNTYNPMLVGLAIERASGESVAEFTSSRLWFPLGMDHAGRGGPPVGRGGTGAPGAVHLRVSRGAPGDGALRT